MYSDKASTDLLAHFDRSKTLVMPEFDGVDELLAGQSSTVRIDHLATSQPVIEDEIDRLPTKVRGVAWVLQWAASMAVLTVAALVLTQFACLLAAERNLALAARAGVLEATLPRATYQSVAAAVKRRMTNYPRLASQLQISLTQNGTPAPRQIRQKDGDRFVISLDAPNSAALPGWARKVLPWGGDARIHIQAERRMPGRTIGAGLLTPPKL